MNLRKRLEKLGEHYKVPRGSMDLMKWSAAIKEKAKSTDSIEVLYDKTFKKEEPAKTEEPKEKPKEGEVIPPGKPIELKVDGASQKVDVHPPAMHFNLAPSSLVVNPGNVSWSYTLQRAAMYAFVFVSGSMAGSIGTFLLMRKIVGLKIGV